MDIKIGLVHSQRELIISLEGDAATILADIKAALANTEEPIVELVDKKNRVHLVRVSEIAYVEFAEERPRNVGFTGA